MGQRNMATDGKERMSAAVRLDVAVRGRVQGVGYRAFVRDTARRLDLAGAVRNGGDGAVYVTAEGPRAALEALLAAVREGPLAARPGGVDAVWSAPSGTAPWPFEVTR